MHLTPHEIEKLMLHNAGFLAQKRLARGVRLNYPESIALIATQVLEFIRDGKTVSELMTLGRQFLGRNQVLSGIPEIIHEVQIEGTFTDGSKLVTVHHPITLQDGNLELALHGSFLPVPGLAMFSKNAPSSRREFVPGETFAALGVIEANANRKNLQLSVTNLGDRPIQVGSHYHFIETNASLQFDRSLSFGMRLDIPAGTAVRFEPGETKTVQLVEIAGDQIIRGGNNLADGPLSPANLYAAMHRVNQQKFANSPSS